MTDLRAILRYVATIPIRLYRILISPLLPPSCIYHPTCSEYSLQSVMKHGVVKGTFLAVGRITRCFGLLFQGGEDHVPERFAFREILKNYRRFRRVD